MSAAPDDPFAVRRAELREEFFVRLFLLGSGIGGTDTYKRTMWQAVPDVAVARAGYSLTMRRGIPEPGTDEMAFGFHLSRSPYKSTSRAIRVKCCNCVTSPFPSHALAKCWCACGPARSILRTSSIFRASTTSSRRCRPSWIAARCASSSRKRSAWWRRFAGNGAGVGAIGWCWSRRGRSRGLMTPGDQEGHPRRCASDACETSLHGPLAASRRAAKRALA